MCGEKGRHTQNAWERGQREKERESIRKERRKEGEGLDGVVAVTVMCHGRDAHCWRPNMHAHAGHPCSHLSAVSCSRSSPGSPGIAVLGWVSRVKPQTRADLQSINTGRQGGPFHRPP